jgi:hypothetical protein
MISCLRDLCISLYKEKVLLRYVHIALVSTAFSIMGVFVIVFEWLEKVVQF